MTTEPYSSKNELVKLKSTIGNSVSLSKPQSQKEMVNQALSVALNSDFLATVNEEVGDPLDGESRDEYINRAQSKIIDKLTSLLR
jgi:hypothetical protein